MCSRALSLWWRSRSDIIAGDNERQMVGEDARYDIHAAVREFAPQIKRV